ncbi:dUTP diphosphatase [Acidaminobacter hydrogenoformans]|uniref:Deoxyuridine 5'-triphosphate nucleotidohydrolase n=1 Tax=Acidaminobacter hydrogenoformans DSM 2784 TaxID=1120920 RepID=A0A1G5RTR2_9FIRM|nr:dUTP diphosphatase [Acidaminobacter hydrogenoformans]SCZ76831.1 dUTP pyrophosphatase [Acidaminobacter hydrogenoformans DSM 2784]
MTLKIRNISDNPLPAYETKGAAGMDLRAWLEEPLELKPFERKLIRTGLFIEIPEGYEGQVRPRSGLSIRHGLTLVNCVGTIDSDYRGELCIPVINLGQEPFVLENGMRIAQLILAQCAQLPVVEVFETEALTETERGTGGFGSTGKH